MERKSQALMLNEFLLKYSPMWSNEIMNEFPDSMEFYPKEWIDLLSNLNQEELFAIDCKDLTPQVLGKICKSSFYNFVLEAIGLSSIAQVSIQSIPKFENWAYNGIKLKKRHEIERIIPIIQEIQKTMNPSFDTVIDIGGGVGHLSRVIAHYANIEAISIDQNVAFQKIGLERLNKFRKLDGSKNVTFINLPFSLETSQHQIKTIFQKRNLCLGLHTCGALANTLLTTASANYSKAILNFGCCYHHLDPIKDFPISSFYQKNNFQKINLYGFSLATRSHAQEDFSAFKTKERVKYYRYALHLFVLEHFNNKYFTDVGECPIKVYWGSFSQYLRGKLDELKLNHEFSDEYLEAFYLRPQTQKTLKKMFIANLIRWQLGRCLEIYILMDRCLYLEERGYDVFIEQYFKEALSPRNIGILALLKT